MSDVLTDAPIVIGVTPSFSIVRDADQDVLLLLRASAKALRDLNALTASVLELRERIESEQLGDEARYDLAEDMFDITSQLQSFALTVRA